MNRKSHAEYILPHVAKHLSLKLTSMYNNASLHKCPNARCEMACLSLKLMKQPANSPDLNPTDTI
jgi:hypothetical protein